MRVECRPEAPEALPVVTVKIPRLLFENSILEVEIVRT